MTNTTLGEDAPTATLGDALVFAVPESAVELRSRTRVRPALKGSTSDQ